MGLTPLEGIVMGTRSGNIDPAIIQYIANSDNISADEVLEILNKKSGVLGISEMSSDLRDIEEAHEKGNDRATFTYELLGHNIRKYIGSYAAVMNGVDAILFTAGVGENDSYLRSFSMKNFDYLGAKLDEEKNKTRKESVISTDDSVVKIAIIPTNEELVIARDTDCLVNGRELQ